MESHTSIVACSLGGTGPIVATRAPDNWFLAETRSCGVCCTTPLPAVCPFCNLPGATTAIFSRVPIPLVTSLYGKYHHWQLNCVRNLWQSPATVSNGKLQHHLYLWLETAGTYSCLRGWSPVLLSVEPSLSERTEVEGSRAAAGVGRSPVSPGVGTGLFRSSFALGPFINLPFLCSGVAPAVLAPLSLLVPRPSPLACLLLIQDWDPLGPDLRPSRPLSHGAPALTPLAVHAGSRAPQRARGRASIAEDRCQWQVRHTARHAPHACPCR